MKLKYLIYLGVLSFTVLLTGCSFDEDQTDPNGPSLNSVLSDASITELNLLVSGIEGTTRNSVETMYGATGTIARELYIFDADPRNTEDLLGKDDIVLDNNTFYLTAPFASRYRVIKNCNTLLTALDNTENVSDIEKDAYRGFANTMKGYMLSQVLGLLGDNGVRIDVADPDNLGGYVSQSEGYDQILSLMDLGFDQMNGSSIIFNLSGGFDGFNTTETFNQFNRAIAARIATQGSLYGRALGYVNQSFLDLNGELNTGPQHVFSTSPGDFLNPLFKPAGQSGDQIIVHPRMITDALPGDLRFNKFALRVDPTSQDGLNGDYETALYATSTTPAGIIRNEELMLIYAEASFQTGADTDAITGINAVRNANNLASYNGDTNDEALTDEILFQRRYSLWYEGQHMFDLRRYGRLNADFLPIDRVGDDIFTQFPVPLSE